MRFLLRWKYGFEMVQAYMAEMLGDDDAADNHLSRAWRLHREWELEMLNHERDLFGGT